MQERCNRVANSHQRLRFVIPQCKKHAKHLHEVAAYYDAHDHQTELNLAMFLHRQSEAVLDRINIGTVDFVRKRPAWGLFLLRNDIRIVPK